jgi:hypothetical protein
MTGIELIAAERRRQLEEEGWTAEHDDQWKSGELARAAACYALLPKDRHESKLDKYFTSYFSWSKILRKLWPWGMDWYKPTPENRIRELEKAGALIAAEIDRLLRLEGKK